MDQNNILGCGKCYIQNLKSLLDMVLPSLLSLCWECQMQYLFFALEGLS